MINKKSIIITSIGTFLEWYEFGVFGYLATYLAIDFLPKESKILSMIYVFAIFGLAYITRPLGGLIFGHIGDKYGRKKAIVISSLLIAIAMLITSCLPTYQQIGSIATVLLILSRLVQGLSVGGEYSGTLVSLIEQANEGQKMRRGIIGAVGAVNANIGFFSSIFLVSILLYFIDEKEMAKWGWRIPFFIGFIIGFAFFLLRTTIDESKLFVELKKNNLTKKHPLIYIFRFQKQNFSIAVLINFCIAILYSGVFVFLPELNKLTNPSGSVNWIIDISLIAFSCLLLFSGYLSDTYGRKPIILLFTSILFISSLTFAFFLPVSLGFQVLIFSILLAFPVNAVNLITTEIFPTQCRYSGMGISFNLANVAGGFTPMIMMIFYHYFQNIFFIYIIIVVLAILLLVITKYFVSETAFEQLR